MRERWLAGRPSWCTYVASTLLLVAAILVAFRIFPAPSFAEQTTQSRTFYSSDGELLRLTLALDDRYRVWVPLDRVSPKLIEAVKLYQDQWFDWHLGVNPLSLARGAWACLTGQSMRERSTLTMQLARRVFRLDNQEPWGMVKQIGAAIWLELRYSKKDLLEAYLNLAPFADNVEGVEAASLIYFGKQASDLNLPEALALAVIPHNPNQRGMAPQQEEEPAALQQARRRLWRAWQQTHPISVDSAQTMASEAAMALPLRLKTVRHLPFKAPHAVQSALEMFSAAHTTTLSLHGATQQAVERVLSQFVQGRRPFGVRNAAALLVDARSMKVRAWVGSADYFNSSIDGQVNATTAKRSPGSTLKPFIYGLGFDQGIIHPRSILMDAPIAFGDYSPENFDSRFEGPITAQDALIRSRNVPAVEVSSRLTNPTLYDFLKRANIRELASESHYGLSLALGAGELTMEELATLYAVLANRGQWSSLSYRAELDKELARRKLLSEEAAYVTLEMLARNPRPDTGLPASPAVAWKTGTSRGYRDAWAAGVFGAYVLVVWVGNFDATSNPEFVGLKTAAPLFFQIIDGLRAQKLAMETQPAVVPAALSKVKVCAASGDLPNAFCSDLVETWFIPGVSSLRLSTLHRPVYLDRRSRSACRPGPGIRQEIFEYWSRDTLELFSLAGVPRRLPPAVLNCETIARNHDRGLAPRIVAPADRVHNLLGASPSASLTLRAEAPQRSSIYWFTGTAFLGQSSPGQNFSWVPHTTGHYTLRAVDANGQADTREIFVEVAP